MTNILAAIAFGVVIGLIGGFVLRGKQPNAIWLAPVLATAGALIAWVAALIFGEPSYGYKEAILQVVLAVAGVGAVAYLGSRSKTPTASATASE